MIRKFLSTLCLVAVISIMTARSWAYQAGFRGSNVTTIVAIALAESGLDPTATNYNPPTWGCPYGSVDRGILQFNDCYNPWATWDGAYQQFFDAFALSGGWNFHPWSTYNNGAFWRYWWLASP